MPYYGPNQPEPGLLSSLATYSKSYRLNRIIMYSDICFDELLCYYLLESKRKYIFATHEFMFIVP